MTDNSLTSNEDRQVNVLTAQEKIYSYLVEIVQNWQPEDVLQKFEHLFLDLVNDDSVPSIEKLFQESNQQEIINTFKRCCYILINNWESNRNHKWIQELVEILAKYKENTQKSISRKNNVNSSIIKFINSNDYQELKLYADRNERQEKTWVNRYASYLLVAQYLDRNNPQEQQEAARKLSQHLKDKFKFELAMYIARSQSAASNENRYVNPSILGDDVLRLIKMIVVKKGVFSYENIANIFIKQTQNQNLDEFKQSIQKYLIYSVKEKEFVRTLKQELSARLSAWQVERNEENINKDLFLRVCNKIIDFLTTEDGKVPSKLFVMLLSQGHPLTLVVVLLKIILISQNSRSHLELRIANLIRYYDKYAEYECQGIIYFLEIFNITFAIYAENIEYNLIKMKEFDATGVQLNLDAYRVFSQLKRDINQ